MDLAQLQLLISIADYGGFSPAARALHLSQPAISTQIRLLEQRLGVRLLERRGRAGTTLTPAGEIVYQYGKEILQRLGEMESTLHRWKQGALGNLTVLASYTCYTYILPGVLREFRRAYPDVRLFSSTGMVPEVLEGVRRKQAEIGIAWGPVSTDFHSHHLKLESFHIVTRWDHPLARKRKVFPQDVAPYPFVLDAPSTSMRAYVEDVFNRAGLRLAQPIEFGTPAGSKEGILAGLGIGVLPRVAVTREVADGLLRLLEVEGLEMARPLVLVHHRDTPLSPHAETFRDFVIEHLRGSEPIPPPA